MEEIQSNPKPEEEEEEEEEEETNFMINQNIIKIFCSIQYGIAYSDSFLKGVSIEADVGLEQKLNTLATNISTDFRGNASEILQLINPLLCLGTVYFFKSFYQQEKIEPSDVVLKVGICAGSFAGGQVCYRILELLTTNYQ
jgi:hypothetical protein